MIFNSIVFSWVDNIWFITGANIFFSILLFFLPKVSNTTMEKVGRPLHTLDFSGFHKSVDHLRIEEKL
jgi:hypothetical protein